MTNAEKYLKDGVDVKELCNGFSKFVNENGWTGQTDCTLIDYLKQPCKPTLTEDERVILRNIDQERYTHIGRKEFDGLVLIDESNEDYDVTVSFNMYQHHFLFIKERRRIPNS